jgi:hypothetical protein
MNMNTTQGSMRPRSAAAPMASAGLFWGVSLVLGTRLGMEVRRGGRDIRDGCEHALVDGKKQIRDSRASN